MINAPELLDSILVDIDNLYDDEHNFYIGAELDDGPQTSSVATGLIHISKDNDETLWQIRLVRIA